jgi:hypothetical protein
MRARAEAAERKIKRRGWVIAKIAAMKNVLSPISDTMIMANDETNAGKKPVVPIDDA